MSVLLLLALSQPTLKQPQYMALPVAKLAASSSLLWQFTVFWREFVVCFCHSTVSLLTLSDRINALTYAALLYSYCMYLECVSALWFFSPQILFHIYLSPFISLFEFLLYDHNWLAGVAKISRVSKQNDKDIIFRHLGTFSEVENKIHNVK